MKTLDLSTTFEGGLELVPTVSDAAERNLVVSTILAVGEQSLNEQQRLLLRMELLKVPKIAEELFQDGTENKARQVALNLLAEGVNVEVSIKATGLSRDTIEELRKTATIKTQNQLKHPVRIYRSDQCL
ncbi:hypothetical protein [Alicyclobacillus mengziensis]|uniref:Uncharacterized protein n=1 Tax=Alicyclobacillus mengziensis TaxID=2931921 RepID=A0A9X7W257_9BACL|nr:hypothetical protein [Alicyclobacillus mengziensis]QSO48807.1 hypothetical protein JZ786_07580 [Alicyclobacillus mengziensis]